MLRKLLLQEGQRKLVCQTPVKKTTQIIVMMEKKMVINMKAHSVLHVEMMKENQSSKSYGLHVIFVMHGITCAKV